jgi:hypothetical protein
MSFPVRRGECLVTKGMALYYTGDSEGALAAFLSVKLWPEGGIEMGYRDFFLATTCWKLNHNVAKMSNEEAARKAYNLGGAFMKKNRPGSADLRRFRAEAEATLGIEPKKD